ncbi:MAG: hypothetical protein KF855_10305 [Acidobacteria bacterium]|nr:hypothetical protein [Acidobacteriota bacterium]
MLSEKSRNILLGKLALDLGYTDIKETTFDDIPFTIEDYSNAILEAEGLTPAMGGDYFRDVCRVVSEVFEMDFDR